MSPPARCLFCCCSFLIAVYQLLSMSAASEAANSTASSCNPSQCADLGANLYPFGASAVCAASPSYVLSNCTSSPGHAYWPSFSDAALGVVNPPAVIAVTDVNYYSVYGPSDSTYSSSVQISWNTSLADLTDPCPPDLFSATNVSLYNIPSSINLTRFQDSSALSFSFSNVILLFNCTRNTVDIEEMDIEGSGCSDYKVLCKSQAKIPCIQWFGYPESRTELLLQQVLDSQACSHFMLGTASFDETELVYRKFNPSTIELVWEDTRCKKCLTAGGLCFTDEPFHENFSHCGCWNPATENYTAFDFNSQYRCLGQWNANLSAPFVLAVNSDIGRPPQFNSQ